MKASVLAVLCIGAITLGGCVPDCSDPGIQKTIRHLILLPGLEALTIANIVTVEQDFSATRCHADLVGWIVPHSIDYYIYKTDDGKVMVKASLN